MNLTDIRADYADMARTASPDNVTVVDTLPDSIAPPAVLVGWGDPWLVQDTLCGWVANIEIMVVAQRIEPGGQYATIENLVDLLVTEYRSHKVSIRDISSPFPLSLGGLDYLSATINITHEVME